MTELKHTIDILNQIPFFQTFPDAAKSSIVSMTKMITIPAGKDLMAEGDLNTSFYFLLEGAVEIYVNNQIVAGTKKFGEVFGEMSILSQTTCLATVKAKVDSSFFIVKAHDLINLDYDSKDKVLKHFYQSCAEVLAIKLKATNQIASAYREVFNSLKKS
jgi:CRP-like cAMP-binding protein